MVGSMAAGRCYTGEVAKIYTLIHRQLAEGDTVPGTGFGNLKVHPRDTLFPIRPLLLQQGHTPLNPSNSQIVAFSGDFSIYYTSLQKPISFKLLQGVMKQS